MSGIILAALVGLLTPQAAPHPSSQDPYVAPAIRPFEPEDDFGLAFAPGDGVAARLRRPLAAPVTIDAYDGAYELPPTDLEVAYLEGVASAEARVDQTAGPLDGLWRIRDAAGRTLYEVVLMDSGVGPAEGGWRASRETGGAVADGRTLTLEGAGVVALERSGSGWRGRLIRDGQTVAVTLSRPD